MKSVHIRNIQPETLEALKRLAAIHHRSLQGELLAILERAALLAPPEKFEPLRLHFVDTGSEGNFSREEIYDDYR